MRARAELRSSWIALGLLTGLAAAPSRAWAEGGGSGDGDAAEELNVAVGYASPAISLGLLGTNPATLGNVSKFRLIGRTSFPGTLPPSTVGLGFGFLVGSGTVGGGLQLSTDTAQVASSSNPLGALLPSLGIGVNIKSLHMKVGLSGSGTLLFNGLPTLNLGILIEPSKKFRVGFEVPGFLRPQAFGVGFKWQLFNPLALVLDTGVNITPLSFPLVPGIWLGTKTLAVTASYGLTASTTGVAPGIFRAGAHFGLGQKFLLQLYYNQFMTLDLCLSYRL